MTQSTAPPGTTGHDDFQIEIDPSLIEEALAAVSRRHVAPADPAGAAVAEGIEIELDPPAAPEPRPEARIPDPNDEERRRLLVRTREQAERLQRVEAELAKVTLARDSLDRQARDLRKAHTELTADFERYRTRARKDAEEAERRGEERALRPIVDVYDNVERAWLHAVSDPTQILSGLQIIVEQFKRLLTRLGFERIEADRGALFDPSCHEAVLHVPSDELLPGLIVDEVHAGFTLRGRLFRAARVTVSAPVEPL